MSVYGDFNDDEQRAPACAASRRPQSRSRPPAQVAEEETVSEGIAAATFILERRPDDVSNTLIGSVILASRSASRRAALSRLRQGGERGRRARGGHGDAARGGRPPGLATTPDEAAAYKRWLMRIAETWPRRARRTRASWAVVACWSTTPRGGAWRDRRVAGRGAPPDRPAAPVEGHGRSSGAGDPADELLPQPGVALPRDERRRAPVRPAVGRERHAAPGPACRPR